MTLSEWPVQVSSKPSMNQPIGVRQLFSFQLPASDRRREEIRRRKVAKDDTLAIVNGKATARQPQCNRKATASQPQGNRKATRKATARQPQGNRNASARQPQGNRKATARQPQGNRKATASQPQANRKPTASQPQANRKPTARQLLCFLASRLRAVLSSRAI